MAKKRALGSGLGALIPGAQSQPRGVDVLVPPKPGANATKGNDKVHELLSPDAMQRKTANAPDAALVPVPGMTVQELPIASISANRAQPREVFDEDALAELANSIRSVGILQPVTVRQISTGKKPKYELVMGERRLRAAKLAARTTIPAIIRETADDEMRVNALLENIQRVNLNPLEEAAAYQQMIEELGVTQETLAKRLSRSRPQIANTLRLLKLPAAVQVQVAAGVLSAGHARALLALEDANDMTQLAQRIVAEGLSVRATEEIVAVGDQPQKAAPKKRQATPLSPDLMEMKAQLEDVLQTRVILQVGKSKGKVTIEFADGDDLARITKIIASR
ncbi:ParB/RepB/Spo0J family partition protein [uncultured Mobiluncus sp.]|uniref:ParB/RepB/Spo0J family partition protein n=1 Tax=uncultured Mobiluncus sp. TaxID=293425 RepID=UPI002639F75C|nr:ParB/RepB/Spo0J family partition protein [uncultured Mobiluncus sp.]